MKYVLTFGALFSALGMVACGGDSRDDLLAGGGMPASATDNVSGDSDAGHVDPEPAATSTSEPTTQNPPAPTTDDDAGSDAGEPAKPPAVPGSVDDIDAFAKTTLDRALQWVKVKMPYCGGTNGHWDVLCNVTCTRTGATASPEWDPYRTDCSGFVSWSWNLPPPGRTTYGFAPLDTSITTAINVDDLRPGDALNNENHIILFGGWTNDAHTKARLLEEYDCGQVAVDRIRSISKSSSKQVNVPGSGTFTAIRYDNRP